MKKLILIIMLLVSFNKIYAYENDYFKVEIPENYTVDETIGDNNYKWIKDNNYIAITISDNTKLKYNIAKFTDKDLENQKKYIEDTINKNLEKYNIKVEVTNLTKSEDNTSLTYNIFYPSKEATGYDIYQKGTMYTTKKYITTFIYSSDSEIIEDNEEYLNIKSSLQILDNPIKETNKYLVLIPIIVLFSIVSLLLSFGISKIKKRK